VNFLIDANLPPALARWLATMGHEAAHVDDLFPPPAMDEAIWLYAIARNLIVITKDSDFVAPGGAPRAPAVVWIRCGNLSLGRFRQWFEERAPELFDLLEAGEVLIELH
jgi:predicted nuclease of predicted toxin-antitoxin system